MQTMMVDYFPRMHTAVAEWLACMMIMLPLRKRLSPWKLAALFSATLGAYIITNQDHFPWLMIVVLDMVYMLVLIGAGCRLNWLETGYYWCHAFISSELAASAEWQINYYLIASGVISQRWQTYITLILVCALVYIAMYLLQQRIYRSSERLRLTVRELVGSLTIVMVAFLLSNFNFAFRDNIFTELLGAGVLYSRTLVDFGGLVMLYAHSETRKEINLRLELEAMENLLNRQYEQYRQFEVNNKNLHRIYHDLKHQIAFIRAEKNEQKRDSYLSELDHVISTHEADVSTGSSVLDTLLTSKNLLCIQQGVQMTCYADAGSLGFMDVMDVCSIFGNAIDNAIECVTQIADRNKRLIKVTVYPQNRFLLIRIENYCEGSVTFDSGMPVTTKADRQMHGYGVKSIKRAVEKYHGHLSVEQEDNWFRIAALLPLPNQSQA